LPHAPAEDSAVRAATEAIEAGLRADEAAFAEVRQILTQRLRDAERDIAAKRREARRKLRALHAVLLPPVPREPKPVGWHPEPPRANGTATKRTLPPGADIDDVQGLRGLSARIFVAAGEAGLTPDELAERVLAEAEGTVLERFARLSDKPKNASDGFYLVRENQAALGVRVERNGPRWRALPVERP
jgi:hypothetical protein